MSRRKDPLAPKAVTFYPDTGTDYGVISCSWERERRKVPITQAAAEKVAEGFGAEFRTEAPW
jgi:hypothetical protein